MEFSRQFLSDESGATAMEYGLLLALLSIVVISAAQVLFGNVSAKFSTISTKLSQS